MMCGAFGFASGLAQNTAGLQDLSHGLAREIAQDEQQLQSLQTRQRELLATKVFLQSDAGVIAAARPLGYGRPTERRAMFGAGR